MKVVDELYTDEKDMMANIQTFARKVSKRALSQEILSEIKCSLHADTKLALET